VIYSYNEVMEELTESVPPSPDHRPATYWVQHTTSCIECSWRWV